MLEAAANPSRHIGNGQGCWGPMERETGLRATLDRYSSTLKYFALANCERSSGMGRVLTRIIPKCS
jgi:hypothetical protein